MTKNIWLSISLLILFLSHLQVKAGNGGGYRVSFLGLNQGLPNDFVDDIYQDSEGFLWLSTRDAGLARYDGYSFRYFGVGLSVVQLRSNSCRNVTEDRWHRLWVAFDEGAEVLDLHTLLPVQPKGATDRLDRQLQQLFKENCDRVQVDGRGFVWILTQVHLYRLGFDGEGRVNDIQSMKVTANAVSGCLRDVYKDGSVLVSFNRSFYRVSSSKGRLHAVSLTKRYPQLLDHYVTDVALFEGKLWVGTTTGLYCSDGRIYTSQSRSASICHDFVSSLAVSPDGKLLVGTLGGMAIISGHGQTPVCWDINSSSTPLSSNFINCIYVHHGMVWVGTETGGVIQLTPRLLRLRNFAHTDSPFSLSPNAVNAMYAEKNGTLWVGTVEGGLNRRAPGEQGFRHYTTQNSGLPHNSVSVLAADTHQRLWIGTWGGGVCSLDMRHPDQIRRLTVDAAHAGLLVFAGALTYDPYNDGLWIGTNDGVYLYLFKSRQLVEPFKGCRNIRGCIGTAITPDKKLWMGCIDGMICVDLKSRRRSGLFTVKHYTTKLDRPESGIHEKILCFCLDKDGTLWLGSSGYGLYKKVRDKEGKDTFINYTWRDGLASNVVRGIAQDASGSLWITTDNGLSVMQPKDAVFTNLDTDDGLASVQFYFNSALVSPSGMVYLGSLQGLTAIESTHKQQSHYWGRLRFTSLTVDNELALPSQRFLDKDISVADKIYLHEGDRSFVIEFSSLNYGPEKMGTYSYRMAGYEDEWITLPPGQNSVRYSTLPPGYYRFEVRYVPGLAGDKVQTVSIAVVVRPYFWKSWWFLSLLIIAVIVLVVVIYRARIRKHHQQEVLRLYQPIADALRESPDPSVLQTRIQKIISNQKLFNDSSDRKSQEVKEKLEAHEHHFMDELMKVVEAHFTNPDFGVEQLCEEMGMSRSALSRKLKEEVGTSALQFIRNYRLDIARHQIMEAKGDLNISTLAYNVGFNDPKYFTRCFSTRYGVAPSQMMQKSNELQDWSKK